MLFVVVQPPPCAARRIIDLGHKLKDMHQLGNSPFEAHRLHITLQSLGDHLEISRQFVSLACDAIATIVAPRFNATFDRALTLCGRAPASYRFPFALAAGDGVAGFSHLKAEMGRILGIRGRASFTPHVTLLYDRKIVRPFTIEPISWNGRRARAHPCTRQTAESCQAAL